MSWDFNVHSEIVYIHIWVHLTILGSIFSKAIEILEMNELNCFIDDILMKIFFEIVYEMIVCKRYEQNRIFNIKVKIGI